MSEPFVAYYRVSTDRQGQSGLGLEAQRLAVLDMLRGETPLAEFTEVETGKGKNALLKRPELSRAIALCRQKKATLLIARLDRLARNVHFISGLMETGIEFRAVDLPSATKFTLHIYAALAEEEGRKISERTKAALGAAKAWGQKLGAPSPELAAPLGGEATKKNAERYAQNVMPVVRELQRLGVTTLRDLAAALTARGIPTSRGGQWYPMTVRNLLSRVQKTEPPVPNSK
jgi:DNA invertase Pin-like site-specific DNA recombinase